MAKITKAQLLKENEELKVNLRVAQNTISILIKRLEQYENIQKQCVDGVTGCFDWFAKTVFTQQAGQK